MCERGGGVADINPARLVIDLPLQPDLGNGLGGHGDVACTNSVVLVQPDRTL